MRTLQFEAHHRATNLELKVLGSSRGTMSDEENDRLRSLHALKDTFTKSHMGPQCDALVANLAEAISATETAAPFRRQGYLQTRGTDRLVDPTSTEARLETAMWQHWRNRSSSFWHRIVSYQVPLRATRKDREGNGWGCVDLLGVSAQGLPVVIEIKREDAADTPAKMLVQAAAYALALRAAWRRGFRSEWRAIVEESGLNSTHLPDNLDRLELVCGAPTGFWQHWRGESARARTVPSSDWTSLERLATALDELHGLPAAFVEVHVADLADGLTIVDPGISLVDLFTR